MKDLERNFADILEEKINKYKNSNTEHPRKNQYIESILNMGSYLNNVKKDRTKIQKYKRQIIEFTDILTNNPYLTEKEVADLVKEYLYDIISFLESEHSFVDRHSWFWSGVFNLLLDIILIIVGVGKYYYYIPIFTIIAVIRNIRKIKKAKKEGRYIGF